MFKSAAGTRNRTTPGRAFQCIAGFANMPTCSNVTGASQAPSVASYLVEVDMKTELFKAKCAKCDWGTELISESEARAKGEFHDAQKHLGEKTAVLVSESGTTQ